MNNQRGWKKINFQQKMRGSNAEGLKVVDWVANMNPAY